MAKESMSWFKDLLLPGVLSINDACSVSVDPATNSVIGTRPGGHCVTLLNRSEADEWDNNKDLHSKVADRIISLGEK
jgi:hypothetical protein